MLEKLIKNFATYIGITSTLEFDADGAYVLPISDLVKIRVLQNADNEIVLNAFLGELPPSSDTNKAYLQMMVANLFGRETGDSALGLNSEGHIVMTRRIPEEVSYEDFARYVESFMNFSETWLEDLGLNKAQQGQ
ncbi:CesT family type III secretion system chaperone [Chlamydia psittaci]|uniref:CesT family type III secretion system chaperone n=1 Tax=Chlamydia psittaci TaxID=83554 RepID=UPI00217D1911|nr:CesT family type III secretion system chaperone [Chlamydia psittaci]USB81205.1 CesT family type III secretion system chaperone [Chlamydia psittaci]UWF54720.1 CesT family type III secretion system chaperone [Chlamydia psittaci]